VSFPAPLLPEPVLRILLLAPPLQQSVWPDQASVPLMQYLSRLPSCQLIGADAIVAGHSAAFAEGSKFLRHDAFLGVPADSCPF